MLRGSQDRKVSHKMAASNIDVCHVATMMERVTHKHRKSRQTSTELLSQTVSTQNNPGIRSPETIPFINSTRQSSPEIQTILFERVTNRLQNSIRGPKTGQQRKRARGRYQRSKKSENRSRGRERKTKLTDAQIGSSRDRVKITG